MAPRIYVDSNGKRVPSVTGIIGRFKDSGGLIHWAWQLGVDGLDYRDERQKAADAGTLAHQMVEAHIRGEEWKGTADAEILAKAKAGFESYLTWERHSSIAIKHTEVSLSSAKHRFGGTLDAIGLFDGWLVLLDWKTSNRVYADYLYQLAAYKLLWEENYPDHPIAGGFHLCRFSKEHGDFGHHHFPSLDEEERTFLLMRELYDRVKRTEKRAA